MNYYAISFLGAGKAWDWMNLIFMRKNTKRMIKVFYVRVSPWICIFLSFLLRRKANFYALSENIRISKFYKLNLLKAFVTTPSCCDKVFSPFFFFFCVYSDDSLYYENIILVFSFFRLTANASVVKTLRAEHLITKVFGCLL